MSDSIPPVEVPTADVPPPARRKSGKAISEAERRQRGQRGLFIRMRVDDLDRIAAMRRPGETNQEAILRAVREASVRQAKAR